jgi:hypothetical protein
MDAPEAVVGAGIDRAAVQRQTPLKAVTMSASTRVREAIEGSPGVVMVSTPWTVP